MTLQLRPYQTDLLSDIETRFHYGARAVMMQLPTGAGKTAVAARWAAQYDGRVLFLNDKLAVIWQAPEEFEKWGVEALAIAPQYTTWERAFKQRASDPTVIVSTPAKAIGRLKQADHLRQFSAIVMDEAHHAPDPIGNRPTRATKIIQRAKNLSIPVLGMTATPWRMSVTQGFNQTWDTLVCGPTWRELRGSYLADVILWHLPARERIRGAGARVGNDYVESETRTANAKNPMFNDGAFEYMDRYGRRPDGSYKTTIMYTVGQEHALNQARLAVKRGIPTGLLISSTDLLKKRPRGVEIDRHAVNYKLQSGELRLVINVNMVQEGYNLPDCECVMVLRPTLSLSLWRQMAGRGSRLTPNKRVLTLIDLTDNHARLGDPMMEFDWSLEPRLTKEVQLRTPAMRDCCDEYGEGCGARIAAGAHICPVCGRAQGQTCDQCGRWWLYERFDSLSSLCPGCIEGDEIDDFDLVTESDVPAPLDADTLKEILLEELEAYTGQGLNDVAHLMSNESEGIYSILDIATVRDMRLIVNVLVVRLEYDRVVIEQDRHDKPLAEALAARCVPPAQIVLAYQGETV